LGTWLRRFGGAAVPGASAGPSLAIVIGVVLPHRLIAGKTKDPRLPGEGPEVCRWCWRLAALVPPCPSVPPGAGNEPKKATKPRKRAKKVEKGYVGGMRIDRHVDAAAVRRDHHGDGAALA
jgi:hypothetical protein